MLLTSAESAITIFTGAQCTAERGGLSVDLKDYLRYGCIPLVFELR